MNEDSRQQRRRLGRERLKAGQSALRGGLHPKPAPQVVLAVTSVIKAKLDECGNDARAGEAAALAHELSEASLQAFPARVEIACKRGCFYCCSTYVSAHAPEIFRVARTLRRSRNLALALADVIRLSEPLRGLGVQERIGRKLPCPLLVSGTCSVYADRPLVCRQATSLSLPACIDEYESPDARGRIEVSAAHITHASNASVLLRAALKASGLSSANYEFSEALAVALSDAESERKWLAGEDIFRDVARAPESPEMDNLAGKIARDLVS